jgi:V8-like Glu-specific endopeptidase
MRFSLRLGLTALALAGGGCVPPAAQVGEQQAPIVGGTTDTGDPAVLLLIIGDINGGSIAMCTGELLSPHVVLTAGHCVNEAGPFNVFRGDDINRLRPADLLPGTGHLHPNYPVPRGSTQVAQNYDIGVVVLDNPITDIDPMPWNTNTDPSTMQGQSIRFVGYGSTGSTSPNDTSAGTKRTVTSSLSRVLDRLLEFDDSRHNTCEGDSGGPALATIDGVETIIGVTSYGLQDPQTGNCAGGGFDTRVDLYQDFVQPFIDSNDPAPPPQPGQQPKPGTLGATCMTADDCHSKICAPGGYCTELCDMNAAVSACGSTMHCAPIDSKDPSQGAICIGNSRGGSSGCDFGGNAPLGLAMLLSLLALASVIKVRSLHR